VIWTNGCFDLIHDGHIHSLTQAKELGDILVVGLNSDKSVKGLKGPNRPILSMVSRAKLLASFFFVDYVLIFDGLTPVEELKIIKPDIFVKGADYKLEDLPEAEVVRGYGGQVLTIPLLMNISSSDLINKIKEPYEDQA
jgi:rfaE bifunctional protein nucleotidyltransferase chain/domain